MNPKNLPDKNTRKLRPAARLLRGALVCAAALAAAELAYRLAWAVSAAAAGPSSGFVLYSVGESTLKGQPYDSFFSPAGLLSRIFGGRLNGRAVEIRELAAAGETVYPQYAKLERALRYGCRTAGAVLIYAGHNDATSRRGIPAPLRAWQRLASVSLLAADLQFAAERHIPALRVRTLDTYAFYLRRLTELALDHGLTPVLFTAAANASGLEPGLRLDGSSAQQSLEAALRPGRDLEKAGRPAAAAAAYLAQADKEPQLKPFLTFNAARCLRSAGEQGRAALLFDEVLAAAAFDNFGRALPWQNALVRELAAEYAVPLVDTDALFRKSSPGGITGWELFADGHHPNMRGYRLLAEAAAGALSAATGSPIRRRFASDAEVFREFGAGAEAQASAKVTAARWLLAVSAQHASPELRLKAAGTAFSEAAKLAPHSLSPRLGLAILRASGPCGLLSTGKGLAWLKEMDLVYGGDYDLAPEKLAAVEARLAACGAEAQKSGEVMAAASELKTKSPETLPCAACLLKKEPAES